MIKGESVRRALVSSYMSQSEPSGQLLPKSVRNDVSRLIGWLFGAPGMSEHHVIGAQQRILHWVKTGKVKK